MTKNAYINKSMVYYTLIITFMAKGSLHSTDLM